MDSGRQPPRFGSRWVVEQRARMFGDPVAKLRYLRSAMGVARVEQPVRRPVRSQWPVLAALAVAGVLVMPVPTASDVAWRPGSPEPLPPVRLTPVGDRVPEVWLVDSSDEIDLYSNGLRIEKHHAVSNEQRRYPVYDRESLDLIEWRTGPVGIVYHTTESHLAPFDPSHNRRLRLVGEWLLAYVQKNRSYHYLIDRFGRVHRVVRETDAANHAGYSVWARGGEVYVNLNPSFLGVAFEVQTEPGETHAAVNPAQLHAALVLTQMLRRKYGIPGENCVTHAQVSVNQLSMRIGNHTDWAADFPFAAVDLGDNYGIPAPAVETFGFQYDPEFLRSTGAAVWKGVLLGEDLFRQRAFAAGVTVAELRKIRKRRYREILKTIEDEIASQENNL